MLKLEHIHKSFGNTIILKDLSLELETGKLCVIEGHNGAGKSTLLAIVSGALLADSGEILLNEHSITRLSHEERAQWIAFLSQDPQAVSSPNLTLLENACLAMLKNKTACLKKALTANTRKYIINSLTKLNLSCGHSLDLPMSALSGGQRQIFAFFMAMLNEPKLLLLDEPTAALDPQRSEQLMTLVKAQIKEWQIPALMISHDHEQNRRHADVIYELREKKLYKK
jgi:putative ABC transport system ATP-binding protein